MNILLYFTIFVNTSNSSQLLVVYFPVMTDIAEKSDRTAVIPFTYSTRKTEAFEGHLLEPSRLSLMAYDAALYVAQQSGVNKIVIAGEQSYREDSRTTGDLLIEHTHPDHEFEITILRNDANRLLNTPHQVDALSDEFKPEDIVTVVCWGFHEERIKKGFDAQKNGPIVEFIHVEDVIGHLWETAALWDGDTETMRRDFKARYNIRTGWEAVASRGIHAFEKRERLTRLAMKVGNNGWLLKLLTGLRGKGRYDDVDEFAMPIQSTTS